MDRAKLPQTLTTQNLAAADQNADERFVTFALTMRDYLVKDSSVLLYYQLSRILRRFIESGDLRKGDRFPTEDAIALNFEVSRQTANRAVQELILHGWLSGSGGAVPSSDAAIPWI